MNSLFSIVGANREINLVHLLSEPATMEILPLTQNHLSQAAALFVQSYKRQRLITPLLPDQMEDHEHIEKLLSRRLGAEACLMAVQNGRLVGYLCWYLIDNFRGAARKGAYVPEWGHACEDGGQARIYQALYRAAGEKWAAAGCQVHAVTLLAQDQAAEKFWYWNGFGLTVVDAIRSMQPLEDLCNAALTIRKATCADANALTQLDHEHWQHYSQSPIFMPARTGKDAAGNIEFLSRPKNSIWLAENAGELAGFIRLEGYEFDSAAILESGDSIGISGAYVRPAYRGQKLAPAMLDAGLRDYQAMGVKYCAVNFESFNPEAAVFWMKYFEPVCFSLLRVPEA
jgi:ribosomal protein S18 acetylase RimI-like enzyme